VDSKVDELEKTASGAKKGSAGKSLRGKIAIANAKITYRKYEELFGGRAGSFGGKGAQTQRLLWASTSTKNPKYAT